MWLWKPLIREALIHRVNNNLNSKRIIWGFSLYLSKPNACLVPHQADSAALTVEKNLKSLKKFSSQIVSGKSDLSYSRKGVRRLFLVPQQGFFIFHLSKLNACRVPASRFSRINCRKKFQITIMCCSQAVQETDILWNHRRSSLLSAPSSVPTGDLDLRYSRKGVRRWFLVPQQGFFIFHLSKPNACRVPHQATSAELTAEKISNHKNVLFTGSLRNGYFVEPQKVFLVVSSELCTDREIGLQKRSKALDFSASAKVLSYFIWRGL